MRHHNLGCNCDACHEALGYKRRERVRKMQRSPWYVLGACAAVALVLGSVALFVAWFVGLAGKSLGYLLWLV